MTTLLILLSAIAVAGGLKYGAEDRPGFDERRPLA
jgi:hypothetical protein